MLLIAELLMFGMLSPGFLSLSNLLYSTSDFIHIGLVALALTLVLISGGIDISFASVMSLSSICMGIFWLLGLNIWIAALLGILVGGLAGAINGFLITITKVQPLVITLATLYLFAGVALVLSGSTGATGYEGISGFPMDFVMLANGEIFGVPTPLAVFLVVALLFSLLLHRTRTGRYIYLIGLNEGSAKYTAVPKNRVLVLTYTLVGLTAGIAGILLTSYFASSRADIAATALLPTITAVVLGGASIYGGQGSILGTVLAALLIGYLQQGLQILGVSSLVSSTLSGVLLIVVIALRHITQLLYASATRMVALRAIRGR